MLSEFAALIPVVERILQHPHREIVVDTPLVQLEELTEPETEGFLELVTDAGTLAPAKDSLVHFEVEDRRYQFTHVYDQRPRVSYDTYPNRFLRWFLGRWRDALAADDPTRRRIDGLIASSILKSVGALQHVSADHSVLRKDPNYREILLASVRLSQALQDPRTAAPTEPESAG